MQITQPQTKNVYLSIKTDSYTRNPSNSRNPLRFVVTLLIVFLLVLGVYQYFSFVKTDSFNVAIVRDFAESVVSQVNSLFLKKSNIDSLQQVNKKREFHEETLSYFSPDEIKKLGILSLPENFQVQDQYKGIRFVMSPKKSFSDTQLGLLKYFIDITPVKLLQPGPTAIVTYAPGEISYASNVNERVAAFASGSYIFFNDNSFNPNFPLADSSVDAAYSTFIHELIHVAQFNHILDLLDQTVIDKFYKEGLSWIDLVVNSNLIADFAVVAGWQAYSEGEKLMYSLNYPDLAQTSDYGKSKIYEDMAESVSAFVSTNTKGFSRNRMQWSASFLEESERTIKLQKFPVPENMKSVNITNPNYDRSKESKMRNNYNYVDIQYFLTDDLNSIDAIHSFIAKELNERGWQGNFIKYQDKNGVLYVKGDFDGKFRDMYIELYSYDQAKGYVVKPRGTIMVVISGYLQKS
ncbi:MAG: hypothetical protein KatS3mg083_002 [Candidatus Dojkabacteria bacterium]|nr:MAG: hypothetical protein KatS3mg083_002 [Candidatus Dojkabacteria bacterium]